MTTQETKARGKTGEAVAKVEPTQSERFTSMVIRQFGETVGELTMTPHQRKLAQHLFIKIDASLKDLEAKRADKGKQPYTWNNLNTMKLALDSVHRIDLGLDALIENHISPIPYWNTKLSKYDLDLRVGYVGKDYYRRKAAIEEPINIFYELVYSTDKFTPLKQSMKNRIESYEFEITSPFERGDIVGGFGYIMFDDSRKNLLVLVSEKDFIKSKNIAKASDFWEKYPIEMRYKTLVHRTTGKLSVDPEKIGESYQAVESDDSAIEAEILEEIAENANQEIIDVDTGEITEPEVEEGQQKLGEPEF